MYYSRVSNRKGQGEGEGQNKRGGLQITVSNNKQGGWNKRGGWQKFPKLINRELEINGEAGKNTAIRNFTETKSSNDLGKILTKRT